MERPADIFNAPTSREDREMARRMLGAWRAAITADGLPREREIDDHRGVLGLAALQGSGFAYPGVVSGIPSVYQDDADHSKGDRKTSFGESASSE